jgi:hypothetical protein
MAGSFLRRAVRSSGFPFSVYERLTGPADHPLVYRRWTMSGHECGSCQVERAIIAVTPVIRGYAMKAFECPNCKSVLKLVVRHHFAQGTTFNQVEKQSAA